MQEITRSSGVSLRLPDDLTINDLGTGESPIRRGGPRLPAGPIPMPDAASPARRWRADRASEPRGPSCIENRWVSSQKDARAFEREMRAYGGQLLDELVPIDVQQDLWELRDQLRAIHVLSEEPFIPWEVVHLKPPPQPGGTPPPAPREPHFLAQKGLVRWLHNRGKAPREIHIREGRAFYVIPDYPHRDFKLPAAQAEIPFLEQRLHATPLAAESNAIVELLEKPGAVDLFHFSGHGGARRPGWPMSSTAIRSARCVSASRPSSSVEDESRPVPRMGLRWNPRQRLFWRTFETHSEGALFEHAPHALSLSRENQEWERHLLILIAEPPILIVNGFNLRRG